MKFLARGDYSQIEARVLPWLAGAEWKLENFRQYDAGVGFGLYENGAAGIYGCDPEEIGKNDPRRQSGKVSELACGFQGGANALQAMAKALGLKIPWHPRDAKGKPRFDIEPDPGTDQWIVLRWRAANPEVSSNDREQPGLWKALDDAAVRCMRSPAGDVVQVGRLSFRRNPKALAMRLPSGRSLYYWTPRLVTIETPSGREKLAVRYRAEEQGRWNEFSTYGGLLTENAVQAAARDVMRDALVKLEDAGVTPVLTVHDEAVCEVEADTAGEAANIVLHCMLDTAPWTDGLPIAADASANFRYLKG